MQVRRPAWALRRDFRKGRVFCSSSSLRFLMSEGEVGFWGVVSWVEGVGVEDEGVIVVDVGSGAALASWLGLGVLRWSLEVILSGLGGQGV